MTVSESCPGVRFTHERGLQFVEAHNGRTPPAMSVRRREILTGAAAAAVTASVAAPTGFRRGDLHGERRGLPAQREASAAAGQALARLGTARVIWSVPHVTNNVAFTFDDGPHPDFTPRILQALSDAGVRATFNVMGWAALHYPRLLLDVIAAGHEIGNHTWTHEDFSSATRDATREQLTRGKTVIEQVTQTPLRFLRPPRGNINGAVLQIAAELGYDILLWSISRGTEPDAGTVSGVTTAVVGNLEAGDVVSLHDGIGRGTFSPDRPFARALWARRDVEVRALPGILARVQERGLTVTTAGDLLLSDPQLSQESPGLTAG